MLTIPKAVVASVVAALVLYVFVVAPELQHDHGVQTAGQDPQVNSSTNASSPSPSPTQPQHPHRDPTLANALFPQTDHVFTGVFTASGPYDFSTYNAFVRATHRAPAVLSFAQGWEYDKFDRSIFDEVAARGMMPFVNWEPWDYKAPEPRAVQPKYALRNIIAGDFDAYITQWAEGVKALGYPIALRFAHEMNGNWYPWATGVNGNKPGEYVEAYQHVHDIFTRVGATDVIWVWSPNVSYDGSTPVDSLYPGTAYVDWLGLVGYYGTPGTDGYAPFNDIFYDSVVALREIANKPIVVTETGASDHDGLQAKWISDMYASLPTYPDIIGVVWFEAAANRDFGILGNPAAQTAYAEGVADARYDVAWTPNIIAVRSPH